MKGVSEHAASRRIPVKLCQLAGQLNEVLKSRADFEPRIDLVSIVRKACRKCFCRLAPALNCARAVRPGARTADHFGDQLIDLRPRRFQHGLHLSDRRVEGGDPGELAINWLMRWYVRQCCL